VAAIEETRDTLFEDHQIVAQLESWFIDAVEETRDAMR
jgi:hypothetical protein